MQNKLTVSLATLLMSSALGGCMSTSEAVDIEHKFKLLSGANYTVNAEKCLEQAEEKAKKELATDAIEVLDSSDQMTIDMESGESYVSCKLVVNKVDEADKSKEAEQTN